MEVFLELSTTVSVEQLLLQQTSNAILLGTRSEIFQLKGDEIRQRAPAHRETVQQPNAFLADGEAWRPVPHRIVGAWKKNGDGACLRISFQHGRNRDVSL